MSQIQEWLERYVQAEQLIPGADGEGFSLPERIETDASSMEEIEKLALELRKEWDLGTAPIEDLVAVLEDQGVRIGIVEGHDKFDACTFQTEDGRPVIVTKRDLPGDRQRFSIAHELGHFVMDNDEEKAAHRFAAAFLVPAQVARAELGEHRRRLDIRELHILKHKYGLSMQAWIYRAKDLGIISDSAARRLFQQFRARGYYRTEPGEPLEPEQPQRLTRLVHRALAEELISRSRAAELLGEPIQLFFKEEADPSKSSSSSIGRGKREYGGRVTSVRH